ncbi:MAG TPA: EF-P lysine aminoacylase EpmA [Alphaproteobacteria bacterium]|jgi:lysyl-tRNA synthetase class 2|nr:EF-P lysine aminoacylase EpmA [Alphaproteobacteria bacterium]
MADAPWWRPELFARRRPRLELRMRLTAATRAFFVERAFLEVETPALQISPGLEPHLMAFATELVAADQQSARPFYLHTSPEFAMKKLLAAGLPRIFQLAHVFRNGERATTHSPEFTMLEWYRYGAYEEIIADTAMLVRTLSGVAGKRVVSWRGIECDLEAEPEIVSVQAAFDRYADGIDLLATVGDMPALIAEAKRIGVRVGEGDRWDDLVLRILAERIEPKLGAGRPAFLADYPVEMAALARVKPSDRRVAERVELYIAGVEIANGFGELTDAAEQRRRFTADMDLKEQLYGQRYPIDEEFLAALESGIPDSAGMALGFDRLVMLLAGATQIDDILWVPVAR